MPEPRARRNITPSKKFNAYSQEKQPQRKKYVLRLLRPKDITQALKLQELYLLWPDDGLWYPAEIQQVDVESREADVIYTTTDEQEKLNLAELVEDKSIAFREARPSNYKLGADELLDTEERPEASLSISRGGDAESGSSAENSGEEPSEDEAPSSPAISEEAAEEEDQESDDDDDEILVGRRRSGGRKTARGGDESDDLEASGGSKRRRVMKGERKSAAPPRRPRRQITLSSKAQELLTAERQAQLEAILQSREDNGEAVPFASPSGTVEVPGKDEFSTAEEYEQKLLSQISGLAPKPSAPRRSSSLKGQASSTGQGGADGSIREKVVEQMAAALEKVEAETRGGAGPLPRAADAAAAVEGALFRLYGDAGKDYRAKYRSLIFNLRDSANPDLRRRVLLAEIPPEKLVRYSANELASKQLSQWREEKGKEALKAAVLDTEAASKFSTAAMLATKQQGDRGENRVDWRDNTLATSSPPRDAPRTREVSPVPEAESMDFEATKVESAPAKIAKADTANAPQEQAPDSKGPDEAGLHTVPSAGEDSNPPPELPSLSSLDSKSTAIAQGSGFDWSNIRASALQELETSAPSQSGGVGDGDGEPSPRRRRDDGQFAIAESSGGAPEQIWHGVLGNACPVPLPVAVEYLAGTTALGAILPSRQMDVKGRVQMDKAREYLLSLKTSRSRTISLAILRLSRDASDDERGQMNELGRQYVAKDRCGVMPLGEAEVYLVAPSPLADGLLRAAGRAGSGLPLESLLIVCVHRKNVKPPRSRHAKEPRAGSKSPARAGSKSPGQAHDAHGRPQEQQDQPQSPPDAGEPPPPPPEPPQAQAPQAVEAARAGATGAEPPDSPRPHGVANISAPAESIGASDKESSQAKQADRPLAAEPPGQQQVPPGLQAIDLGSLGSLAAVLGVSSGLQFGAPPHHGHLPSGSMPSGGAAPHSGFLAPENYGQAQQLQQVLHQHQQQQQLQPTSQHSQHVQPAQRPQYGQQQQALQQQQQQHVRAPGGYQQQQQQQRTPETGNGQWPLPPPPPSAARPQQMQQPPTLMRPSQSQPPRPSDRPAAPGQHALHPAAPGFQQQPQQFRPPLHGQYPQQGQPGPYTAPPHQPHRFSQAPQQGQYGQPGPGMHPWQAGPRAVQGQRPAAMQPPPALPRAPPGWHPQQRRQ